MPATHVRSWKKLTHGVTSMPKQIINQLKIMAHIKKSCCYCHLHSDLGYGIRLKRL